LLEGTAWWWNWLTRGVGVGSYEPEKSGGSGLMGLQVTMSLAMGRKGSGLMELKYFERIDPNSARPVRELEAGQAASPRPVLGERQAPARAVSIQGSDAR
jgi:hypothetical protein